MKGGQLPPSAPPKSATDKAGLEDFAEISQAFLFDTIEIDRNENNWHDSFQTIAVHANVSYKQKCIFFSGMHHKQK